MFALFKHLCCHKYKLFNSLLLSFFKKLFILIFILIRSIINKSAGMEECIKKQPVNMNGNNYFMPSLHLPLYFEGSSRNILVCPGGIKKVYFDSNIIFQNVYAAFFNLTTFELICRLSPQ